MKSIMKIYFVGGPGWSFYTHSVEEAEYLIHALCFLFNEDPDEFTVTEVNPDILKEVI